jgi:hypothetical protein
MAKLGKPKGVRNKRTLEKLDQMATNSANAASSTDSQPFLDRGVEPGQETSAPMTTPVPITPWMHWSALSSTGTVTDDQLSMCLDEQIIQNPFDLDASLHSGSIDRGLLQVRRSCQQHK